MTTQIEMIGYGKVVRDGRVVAIVNDKDEIITVLSDGLFYEGLRTIAAGGSSDLWNFSAGSWERVRFLWVEASSGPVYVWAVVDKPTDEDNGDWTAAGTHETNQSVGVCDKPNVVLTTDRNVTNSSQADLAPGHANNVLGKIYNIKVENPGTESITVSYAIGA